MKSTAKTIKSSAPPTDPSAPPLARKSTRPPRVKSTPAAPAAETPAPAPAPESSSATVITAKIDVGFGNTLYIRGDGPGLSWNKGLPLACVANDTWTVSIADAKQPVTFKFLINDGTWNRDSDYVAAPGSSAEYAPTF